MKLFKQKKRPVQRKNTLDLKYLTSLEENVRIKEKLIGLQDKVITLQKVNIKQKEELLAFKEKEIKKLKEKKKW